MPPGLLLNTKAVNISENSDNNFFLCLGQRTKPFKGARSKTFQLPFKREYYSSATRKYGRVKWGIDYKSRCIVLKLLLLFVPQTKISLIITYGECISKGFSGVTKLSRIQKPILDTKTSALSPSVLFHAQRTPTEI